MKDEQTDQTAKNIKRTTDELFRQDIIHLKGKHKYLIWIIGIVTPILGSVIILPLLLNYYLESDDLFSDFDSIIVIIILAIGITSLLLAWGFITGFVWRFYGKYGSEFLFVRPLKFAKNNPQQQTIQGWILKIFFGKTFGGKFIYLETPDIDHSNPLRLSKSVIKIVKIFSAMFIIILNGLLNQSSVVNALSDVSEWIISGIDNDNANLKSLIEIVVILFFSFILSLTILALYLPLSLVTDDVRLYEQIADGRIKYTGSFIRNFLDNLFGITSILSGFFLIENQLRIDNNFAFFINIGAFFALLVIILIYMAPILVPALIVYYQKHTEFVNNVRHSLHGAGFPVVQIEWDRIDDLKIK